MRWKTEWWKSQTQEKKIKEKRMKRTEESLRDLWDNIKHTKIHMIGILEGEERKDQIRYSKRW